MEDLPRIPPSDTKVIFIQIIISINIAIAMKLTNGKIIIHKILMMMMTKIRRIHLQLNPPYTPPLKGVLL